MILFVQKESNPTVIRRVGGRVVTQKTTILVKCARCILLYYSLRFLLFHSSVCVCVCERETDRERESEGVIEREIERE